MPDVWWYEKRGCWCADAPDPTKKRKRLYLGPDKDKARQQLFEYLAGYYAQQNSEQQSSPQEDPPLAKIVAQFCQWAQTNIASSTLQRYIFALKLFVEKFGTVPAAQIRLLDAEQHKADLKAAGGAPRTINFFVQAIKRVLNWGVEYELLEENPLARLKRVPKAPLQDRSLDDDKVEAFLQYAHLGEPLGDICEVLLHTGMRIGELLTLKWSDIDTEQSVARVFSHKTAQRGDQRPRTIPLNEDVLNVLQQQPQVGEFIFTGKTGQPLTYNALKCRKDRLERKYPDMPSVTFHQFRHTLATRLARKRVPERVAQEILGHASKLMTRYYTSTSIEEMLDAVGKVDKPDE